MASRIRYEFDARKLQDIQDFLSKDHKVKIGIVAGSEITVYENGLDSVGLGMVHEFGSQKMNIPKRSFLLKTMVNYQDKFSSDMRLSRSKIFRMIADGEGEKFLNQIGSKWVRWVHATFKAEGPGWAAHSARNLARRQQTGRAKGNKANKEAWPLLQDTGALLRSISHEVISGQ